MPKYLKNFRGVHKLVHIIRGCFPALSLPCTLELFKVQTFPGGEKVQTKTRLPTKVQTFLLHKPTMHLYKREDGQTQIVNKHYRMKPLSGIMESGHLV